MVAFAELDLEARTDSLKKAQEEVRKIGAEGDKTENKVSKATAAMSAGFGKLATAAASLAGVLASGALFRASIAEAEKFQTSMFRVEAIIKATNGVAGRSADQLREQARSIAWSTLESTEGVLKAQQTLLTFRNVQGQVFDRTIKAAADMTAALGGDLNSATMQLAKALENPTEGLSALSRSGTVFTDTQKDMVKAMVAAGDMASAQAFILAELEAQYGGTATAAASGLAGAQDTLGQAMQEAKLAIASQLGLLEMATAWNNNLAAAVIYLTDNIDTISGIVIAASTAFTVYMAPSLLAAAAAAGAFVVSLVTLKGALLATGIGALVIGAGWLIGKFIELVRHTGGWGNALTLLGEVAAGVWEGIKTSATSIPPALSAVWHTVRANFYAMVQDLANIWAGFLSTMGAGYSKIPGMGSVGGALTGMAGSAVASMAEFDAKAQSAISTAAKLRAEAGEIATSGFDAATEAVGRLSEAVKSVPSIVAVGMPPVVDQVTGTATDIGGGGGGGAASDGFADKLAALTKQFETERDLADEWYNESQAILADRRAMELLGKEEHAELLLAVEEEYQARLAEIKTQGHEAEREMMNTTLDATVGLLQQFGEKSKALAVAALAINAARRVMEIRANTAAAVMRAYAELGPVAGSVAAAKIKVMGAVQTGIALASAALSGAGGGGGGGGSVGGSGGGREATTAPAQQERIVRLDVRGEGMFADMLRESGEAIIDAITNEGKYGGTTVVMGR